jgi:hypothetical protein
MRSRCFVTTNPTFDSVRKRYCVIVRASNHATLDVLITVCVRVRQSRSGSECYQ